MKMEVKQELLIDIAEEISGELAAILRVDNRSSACRVQWICLASPPPDNSFPLRIRHEILKWLMVR